MRVAVVGAGIAGSLLGWRLCRLVAGLRLEVYTGTGIGAGGTAGTDATGASGGLVRGFEPQPAASAVAAESLAEIRGSASLRAWSGYREIGSVYLLPPGADPGPSLAAVDGLLPASAAVLGRAELGRQYPFHDLPAGTLGVVERHSGFLSPSGLRAALLTELAAAGIGIRTTPAVGVTPDPAVRLADGSIVDYDVVVVAAGAWTPGLLASSGNPATGLRTKPIQYTMCTPSLPGLGAFVDDTSGLYGRPVDRGAALLGLPTDRWDVDPDTVTPDLALVAQVTECTLRRLGSPVRPGRTVASSDCYHDPPGLALRPTVPGSALFTFTGGSGGAAKTAVAASRVAANALVAS